MLPIQVLVTTNEGEIRLQVGGAHRGSTKVLAIIFLQQTDRQLKHAPPGGSRPQNTYAKIFVDPLVRKINDRVNSRFNFGSPSTSLRNLSKGL